MTPIRTRIEVGGVVQGVGFRPFVRALARRHGLAGCVANHESGARIEVEGDAAAIERFAAALIREAPPLAAIEAVTREPLSPRGERGFAIAPSRAAGPRRALVSPDVATCDDCLRELFDPADRRHRHAFVNCTNCGPRYTILREIPYDRPHTTMRDFPMCADCAREYADPDDRRHHAQPLACPRCGPRLALVARDGKPEAGDPIERAAALLRAGFVLAVKGVGGFHLAVLATSEPAVAALRLRKRRFERPLALMAADLDAVQALVELGAVGRAALTAPARPIVLARRRAGAAIAPSVAPGNRWLGVMLPYAPLHHLLARALGAPFVLTSGNPSDEPIAYRDDDAWEALRGIADFFLVHDRPIHARCDDSVVRVQAGHARLVRRARGFAPKPIALPFEVRRPVLAYGAELKSTFCLARGRHAFLSPHIGDLENAESLRSFTDGIAHFERLFDTTPAVVAYDLHPEYLSTKLALERDGVRCVAVQHHHAHAAACLAEHGEPGPALALCFDGLGWGADGTLWGGELLVADWLRSTRRARFRPVPMPGGSAAIREPWRMAVAYLVAAGLEDRAPALVERHRAQWPAVLQLARSGFASPATSSVGRLFDAAAALLGVRDVASYEGQAAAELEQLADAAERGAYPARIERGPLHEVVGADLISALVEDAARGAAVPLAAARFHNGLARACLAICESLREETGLATVALSGGVFQNALLVDRVREALAAAEFRVLMHREVPPNDGGIAFGQAVVAAARDRAGIDAASIVSAQPFA